MEAACDRIRIWVNGVETATAACTLDALIDARGFAGLRVATAVNGRFVAGLARARTILEDGDRIEIVSPRQGG